MRQDKGHAAEVAAFVERWVNEGWKVTVVTCAPNCPTGVVFTGYRNRLFQREQMDGIEVVRVWTHLAPNKGAVLRTMNYLTFLVSATFCCGETTELRFDRFQCTSPTGFA